MAKQSPSHIALGSAIREVREQHGLSQERLGFEAGVDRTYVSSIERGHRNISFDNLVKIAEALDVKPSQILRRWEDSMGWGKKQET